jgi:hypothetical protein
MDEVHNAGCSPKPGFSAAGFLQVGSELVPQTWNPQLSRISQCKLCILKQQTVPKSFQIGPILIPKLVHGKKTWL